MGDKLPARDRLMKAAAELFYNDGVGATGIDTITARAGVAKMSLYNNFASKAELVAAYIEARHAEWLQLYHERLKSARTPKDGILAVFDSYLDHAAFAYERGFRGCGLLNAAAELPVGDPGRAVVAEHKAAVERLLKEHLADLKPAAGSKAVAEAAEHLSYLLEGAMARAGLDGGNARLKKARRMAIAMIDRL